MTHEPMCPRANHGQCEGCTPQCGSCQCDLIAKVREDQRRRDAAAELTRLAQEDGFI